MAANSIGSSVTSLPARPEPSVDHGTTTTSLQIAEHFDKRYADVIIPEGGMNQVAMDMVIARIESLLMKQG